MDNNDLRNELAAAKSTIQHLAYQFSDGLDDGTRMSVGRQMEKIEMTLAIFDGKPYLKELDVPDNEGMYVIERNSLYEMRQVRYRDSLALGREHPHDLCAAARSIEEMRSMVDKWWPDTDYSAVEKNQ